MTDRETAPARVRALAPALLAAHVFAAPVLLAQQAGGAATGVRGAIVSVDGDPVAAATVELRVAGDPILHGSTLTTAGGRFRLDSVAPGVYHLLVRHVGFGHARTEAFTVAAGRVRDLGPIRLEVSAFSTEPIVVHVGRPDVRFEPDRTGYLVEALASLPGASIGDAFLAIPELEVDFDGGLRLRGERPAIYVDGQPAPMTGLSLEAFLQRFPAELIERIEVIDNPSGRFAAEGAGGIVNIVLKEGVELGLTGGVSIAAGSRGERSTSGRATVQRGRWVASAAANAGWSELESSDFTLRENRLADPTTFLRQDARSDGSSRSVGAMLNLRYELSPRMHLSARANVDENDGDRLGATEIAHLDGARDPTLVYDRLSTRTSAGGSRALSLGFSHAWEPRRHELDVRVRGRWNDDRTAVIDDIEADPADLDAVELPPRRTLRDDETDAAGVGVDVGYQRPLGEAGEVAVGISWERDESSEVQAMRRFDAAGADSPDSVDFRRTAHDRTLRGAHLTVERRLGPIGVYTSLRAERVRDAYALPAGGAVVRDETNLFPNLTLTWSPGSTVSLRVGYSQRTQRPDLAVLDPTDRSTDPLHRLVGNPDIRSSTSHGLNAFLMWRRPWGMISFGPFWNRTTDGWERVTTADEAGISTSTWANLASRSRLGTAITLGARSIAGFNGFVNLSAGRSSVAGSAVTSDAADGDLYWSARANLFRQVAGPVAAQGSFTYQPGRELPQGSTSGRWTADLGFRVRLLDDRATVGVSLRDPFGLRSTSQVIRDPTVLESSRSSESTRSVSVSLSYGFGAPGGRRDSR